MVSGSAILPCPISPLASSPLSAGIMICPKLSAIQIFFVEGCAYISRSIAGAINTGHFADI
jgi:hypothetical protein